MTIFTGQFHPVFVLPQLPALYIPVYAKLTDGTGNVSKTTYLHFELQNCGSNFPIVPGNSQVVVQTAFDIKPNQSDGSILGQVIPNVSDVSFGCRSLNTANQFR